MKLEIGHVGQGNLLLYRIDGEPEISPINLSVLPIEHSTPAPSREHQNPKEISLWQEEFPEAFGLSWRSSY